ncbi:ATPase/histidine kinase/DNA gyrase B/HSP90 domain containing protein [Balamuthia mandrillaris]
MECPTSITAAELVATMDWSKTPIGPREEWPPQLVAAVELCLESTFPMALYLGPGRNLIYGDAWRPTLGTKHPQAMGQPGQKVWEEIWNVVGILMDEAYSSGKGVLCHDTRLMMERHGYVEETYYSFSFSPLRGPDNSIIGLVNVCFETSQRVMSERRLNTLSELAIRTPSASCLADACKLTAQTLKGNKDIPFAFIYLASEDNKTATLVASTFEQDLQREDNDKEYAPDNASKEQPEDFPSALLTLPTTVSLTAFDEEEQEESNNLPRTNSRAGVSPRRAQPTMNPSSKYQHAALGKDWPVAQVFATGTTMLVSLPEGQGRVMLVPVTTSYEEQGHTSAVMVARVNPFLPFDTYYEEFYNLVGGHLSTALNNAKAREEERKRAEKLAELDKAKTDFFCNISHEFRTPLTLIVAPLADLLQSENLLPDHRQQLETVFRNGQRLLKLVNTLLDFSRIEVGRVQARYRPIDLGTFTQELVSEFESSAERLGLQLITRCVKSTKSANEEEIYVDKDMWEKIVLNLVSNALKFTWKGSITVSVERVNGGMEMQVKDTGVGIAEKDLQKLFQRFYRIQNDKARSHEGSGIGLALAQELVKLHGGTIRVESQEGKGTTFTVFIPSGYKHLPRDKVVMPLSDDVADCGQRDSVSQNKIAGCYTTDQYASEILNWDTNSAQSLLKRPMGKGEILDEKVEEEEAEDERERQEEEEEFEQEKMEEIASEMLSSKPRVLIADDNADMRNYVSRLLSPHFRVTTVTNGAEALRMICRVPPPDLVISDVMMPIKDGFSLLHDVRANKKTHSIPFILLSARAGPDASAEGLDSGADDYLAKPFSATELVAKARATVKLSRLRKQMNLREKQLVKRKHLVMRIGEKIRCGKISMQEVLDSTVAEVRAVLKADAVRIYRFEEVARKRSITSTNHGTTEEASGTDSDGEVKGTQRHGDYDTGDPERKNTPQQDSSPPQSRRQKLQPSKAQNSIRRRSLSADSGQRRIKKNGKDLEVPDRTLAAKEYEDRYVGTEEAVAEVEEEECERDARYPCPTQQVCTIPAESVDSHRLPEKRYLGLKFAMNNCESGAGLWDVNFSATDIWQDSTQTERLVAMLPNELQAENSISAIIPMRDKVWGLLQCVRWAPLPSSSTSSRLVIQEMRDNSWSKVDKALLLQIALQVGLGLNQARLMEERMQQQTQLEAAQAANKAKSMIMANTSHEIRTPLNAIIGMMEMLRDTPLNAEQKEMVQTLQHSSELLLEIVNDILDFSRMEMDKVLFHCSEFEVGSLVERTMDMFAEQAGMRQIELVNMSDLVTSRSGLWVRSDPFRLQQVLVNLINNAIKFTERGGEVMVKVRYSIVEQSPIASSSFPHSYALEPGAETATGESQENESDNFGYNPKEVILHVEIIDTGIGISEEGVQKIFQSFSQVNSSTTREHGGTGLGLAISKRLVEIAGGEIGVTTKPGKGSTFWFTWRCQLLPSPSSSSASGHRFTLKQLQTSYSTDGCLMHPYDQRVLVIEAKQHSLDSILLQLCDIVECEGSTSMEQGLRLFYRGLKQGRPFTIIVLDIASPNLESAINTGRALHRHQSWLRVVLMSGSSQTARGLARQGLAMLGSHLSSGYVTKPIKKSELTKCIRAAIAKSLSSWHSLSGCKDREKGYQQQRHPSKEEEEEEEEQQEETERNTAAGHPSLVQKSETKNEEKDVTQTTPDKTNHILVVEDNRVNIKVVLAQLRKLGLPATVATNGKEAIDIINAAPTGHFALVLMDLAMPIMDGYEATKQLREMSQRAEMDVRRRRYLSNLPIVALSASGMDRDQQRCEEAGMTAFMSKPLKLAQLRQTLQRWLPIPLSE